MRPLRRAGQTDLRRLTAARTIAFARSAIKGQVVLRRSTHARLARVGFWFATNAIASQPTALTTGSATLRCPRVEASWNRRRSRFDPDELLRWDDDLPPITRTARGLPHKPHPAVLCTQEVTGSIPVGSTPRMPQERNPGRFTWLPAGDRGRLLPQYVEDHGAASGFGPRGCSPETGHFGIPRARHHERDHHDPVFDVRGEVVPARLARR